MKQPLTAARPLESTNIGRFFTMPANLLSGQKGGKEVHLLSVLEILKRISLFIAAFMMAILSLNATAQTSAVTPNSGAKTNSQSTSTGALPIPRKENGDIDFDKWFAGKNRDQQEEMADALTDRKDMRDYTKYSRIENAKIVAENAKNAAYGAEIVAENAKNAAYGAEIVAVLAEKKAEGAKLDAVINAIAEITAAGKKLQRGEALTTDEKNRLKIAVNTPGVKQHLIDGIKRHVNLD